MSKENSSNQIGFAGALFLIFLILKLTKVIEWSWWWITSPLWIPAALVMVMALCYFLFKYIQSRLKRKK